MNFKPAKDRLLVRPLDEEKIKSIIVPNTALREQRKGEIVAVGGSGVTVSDGKIIELPPYYHVGEKILYQNIDLQDIVFDGIKYQLVPAIAVLGIM